MPRERFGASPPEDGGLSGAPVRHTVCVTIAAVLLAAGGGSRFEGEAHKLVTPIHKRPLISWSVGHALAAGLDETIVVSGAVDLDAFLPDSVTLLDNHDWELGQASSLRVAISWAQMVGHEAVVVGVGDQPLVHPSAWTAVAETVDTSIATAVFHGHRAPPTRLSADIWGMLPIAGDEGARGLIRQRPDLVTEVECVGRAVDVDTLTDLEKLEGLVHTDQAASWT